MNSTGMTKTIKVTALLLVSLLSTQSKLQISKMLRDPTTPDTKEAVGFSPNPMRDL